MQVRKIETKSSNLSRGAFALGVCIGLGLGLILALGFEVVFDRKLLAEPLSFISLVAALAALSSASLALFALNEQKRSRQAGTDPVLIAHLASRRDAPIMIHLNISNVGAGAAMNVRLDAKRPKNAEDKELLTNIFEVSAPIRTILQNSSIEFPLHTGPNLFADPRLEPFEVAVSYEDIEGNLYSGDFVIDISELERRSVHKDPDALAAEHLKTIAETVKKLGTRTNKLEVLLQTQSEKAAEDKAWLQSIEVRDND